MPTFGIIDARDPRFVSTVRVYERVLVESGLMLRYRDPHDSGETTSAFSVCSFWWVEALAMMGELEKAVHLFNLLLTHANPLGLFSENIDPKTGRLLGNFPHAHAHVGLILAAFTIAGLG
jgi:GH15 family glucan-1,4-alpha-glucosidase